MIEQLQAIRNGISEARAVVTEAAEKLEILGLSPAISKEIQIVHELSGHLVASVAGMIVAFEDLVQLIQHGPPPRDLAPGAPTTSEPNDRAPSAPANAAPSAPQEPPAPGSVTQAPTAPTTTAAASA